MTGAAFFAAGAAAFFTGAAFFAGGAFLAGAAFFAGAAFLAVVPAADFFAADPRLTTLRAAAAA